MDRRRRQTIDVRLARDGRSLHRCPEGSRLFAELGSLYLMRGGVVVRTHVNFETLARELGVLEQPCK